MPRPSHPQTILGKEWELRSSSFCNYLCRSLTFSILGPDILLITWFSDNLNLWSFLTVIYQVLHSYKTTSNIIALFISTVRFLDRKLEDKYSEPNRRVHLSWISFRYVTVVLKYLNIAKFSEDLIVLFILWICHVCWWHKHSFFCVGRLFYFNFGYICMCTYVVNETLVERWHQSVNFQVMDVRQQADKWGKIGQQMLIHIVNLN